MAVHGTRHRESVSWNYAGLLQFLGSVARERTGLPLLRCYWYEATVEGRRSAEHDALAYLPGVKLRLGRMRPGRREGVESEIHRDLTTLARNGALQEALVVSAEEDLAQVIADVQDLGLRVTLIHITVDGNWTISRALRQECDDVVEVNEAHLRPYVELVVGAEPLREDERHAVGAHSGRPLTNGHGHGGPLGQQQALPAGSHPAPPEIYTGPVIAEYQRTAQPAMNGQPGTPQPASASGPSDPAGMTPSGRRRGSRRPRHRGSRRRRSRGSSRRRRSRGSHRCRGGGSPGPRHRPRPGAPSRGWRSWSRHRAGPRSRRCPQPSSPRPPASRSRRCPPPSRLCHRAFRSRACRSLPPPPAWLASQAPRRQRRCRTGCRRRPLRREPIVPAPRRPPACRQHRSRDRRAHRDRWVSTRHPDSPGCRRPRPSRASRGRRRPRRRRLACRPASPDTRRHRPTRGRGKPIRARPLPARSPLRRWQRCRIPPSVKLCRPDLPCRRAGAGRGRPPGPAGRPGGRHPRRPRAAGRRATPPRRRHPPG
ncbi:MAG: hypothetical protein ACTHPS_08480, partial [Streptosporangiaceae bacterium]